MHEQANTLLQVCPPGSLGIWTSVFLLLKLLLLHFPAVYFSYVVSKKLFGKDFFDRALSGMAVYFFLVTFGVWVCSWLGIGFFYWLYVWSWGFGVAGIVIRRRGRKSASEEISPADVRENRSFISIFGMVLVTLIFFSVFLSGVFFSRFDHDPLTYQLNFAAAWLKAGEIFIIPTPFGDPSHAYGPQIASTF
jgi:hypothetical protein